MTDYIIARGQNEPTKLRNIRIPSRFPPPSDKAQPGSERRGRIFGIWALKNLVVPELAFWVVSGKRLDQRLIYRTHAQLYMEAIKLNPLSSKHIFKSFLLRGTAN